MRILRIYPSIRYFKLTYERRSFMVGSKEAFIDVEEVQHILSIGKTKAYAIIKSYNNELAAKGFLTIRGRCLRKYFEKKIYGYADYYNPAEDLERNQSLVAEENNYQTKEKALTN
jgi:hypothetical protein